MKTISFSTFGVVLEEFLEVLPSFFALGKICFGIRFRNSSGIRFEIRFGIWSGLVLRLQLSLISTWRLLD